MNKYIGTKLIEAEPETRVDGEKAEMGYKVRYEDGFESWSPKDVFEKAYMKLEVNPGLRTGTSGRLSGAG